MIYTCPCCGYRTLDDPPGSYDICGICFWEDDTVQLLDPWYAGGANKLSLVECQRNFRSIGVSEERFRAYVRTPGSDEQPDPQWRPVEEGDRKNVRRPGVLTDEEWDDPDIWYYWKRNIQREA